MKNDALKLKSCDVERRRLPDQRWLRISIIIIIVIIIIFNTTTTNIIVIIIIFNTIEVNSISRDGEPDSTRAQWSQK